MNNRLLILSVWLASLAPAGGQECGYPPYRYLPQWYVPGTELSVVVAVPDLPAGDLYETIPAGWQVVRSVPSFADFDPMAATIHWALPLGIIMIYPSVEYTLLPPPKPGTDVFFDGHLDMPEIEPWCPAARFDTAGSTRISQRVGTLRETDQWATIQQSMDNCLWGDTVIVPGRGTPFLENVFMKAGVNLAGVVDWPNYGLPVIEAASADEPAITAAPYCKISGFVIRSAGVGIRVLDPTVEISNCIIMGTSTAAIEYVGATEGKITNCTIVDNEGVGILCHEASPNVAVSNSILVGNGGKDVENCTARFCLLEDEIEPGWGENNIFGDPMFVNSAEGDYRLLRGSPCTDAGDNTGIAADAVDILSKPRILFGGKSETVDLGAYEYWFISLSRAPDTQALQLRWSSAPEKTYTVFYSTDFLNWQTAGDNIPSAGAMTLWSDPIAWPPSAPTRFYRIMQNE